MQLLSFIAIASAVLSLGVVASPVAVPDPEPAPVPSIVPGEGDVFSSEASCHLWYKYCYYSAKYGKWKSL